MFSSMIIFSFDLFTIKPSQQRPTPLLSSEVDEYLLALSQEYRGSIRDSPFYLKPKTVKRGNQFCLKLFG